MVTYRTPQSMPRYRWAVLLASLFAFVMYGYSLQSVPPLLKEFQSIFGVNEPAAGLLMSAVVLPGVAVALPAGVLIGRYGFRKLGFLSALTVAFGSLLMSLTSNFSVALLARLIVGFGGGLLSVGTPSIVPQWFQHREMGKAMAVYAIGVPLATTAAFFTVPMLAQNFGWQFPFYLTALIAAVSAVVLWLIVRDGPLRIRSAVKLGDLLQTFSYFEIWKVSIVWMFFNIVAIGFLTWAPDLFVVFKGLSFVYSSVVASLVMISNFVFVPLFGLTSDRLGKRKPFIIAGLIFMALSLYAIVFSSGVSLTVSILVLGAAAGGVPPLVMAITAQTLPQNLAETGFGLVTFWQNLGIAITAPIVGYFISSTNSLSLTFFGLSVFGFVGSIVALTLRSK